MSSVILTKFNKYVYFPDLANKFNLASYVEIIPTMKYSVYLKYIFSQRGNYSYIALKALMMLNSIYPQRCHYFSRIIVLKYAKTRSHSVVYFKLNIEELSTFLKYSVLKPTTMSTALTGHIRESKFFIFPGFIRHLKIPSWNYFVNISWNHTKKDCYPAFFHKSAYLD